MLTHSKKVKEAELSFYVRAAAAGIAPPIVEIITRDDGTSDLITYRMPIVLIDVIGKKQIAEKILDQASDLVNRLHQIKILHNDLSEENIVYNPDENRTYLIDFGLSCELSKIKETAIPNMVQNLYEGIKYASIPKSNSIKYLLSVESGIIIFLKSCHNQRINSIAKKYFDGDYRLL